MMDLAHRIKTEKDLGDLRIRALGVAEEVIHKCIQEAAYNVLSTWMKTQSGRRKEAYINLLIGLEKAQMNELAADLKKLREGQEDVTPPITRESKN